MSGNQYTPYYSVPTVDQSVPLTYPPTFPATPLPRPGPSPHSSQHTHVPTSSASASFPYSADSPKPWKQELEHDFTADPKRPTHLDDPNRWSFSSTNRPPGMRRFSLQWFRYYFTLQMGRRRLPRLMYGLSGIILLAVWLGIATRFAMTLESAEASNRIINTPPGKPDGFSTSNSILFFLSGQVSKFDPSSRTLSIGWSALMLQGPILEGASIESAKQVSVEAFGEDPIAIYRDTIARPDKELVASGNFTDYTPFRLRAPEVRPIGYLGISDFDQINTDIGLGQQTTDITTQPEFGYPFDVFTGNITLVAANNGTIIRTGRLGSDIMRMNGAILTDAILNFKVRTSTYATCLDPIAPGCEVTITFWVTRTGLVKFCVIVVFCVNWIITIAIFLITGEALLLNRANILEGTDILAICFTALFALPSVRSLLPGVPSSYGCLLDILGILPNVIIVTLCTTFFANSRLGMRKRQALEAAAEAKKA